MSHTAENDSVSINTLKPEYIQHSNILTIPGFACIQIGSNQGTKGEKKDNSFNRYLQKKQEF